eukprot:1350685-Prymnesium_polylepis.2
MWREAGCVLAVVREFISHPAHARDNPPQQYPGIIAHVRHNLDASLQQRLTDRHPRSSPCRRLEDPHRVARLPHSGVGV